ncbi:uncharacterized membrane-anchored protein YitT (DUF2179 family) [Lactobacillus colini]|uniref:Uncharacterized membrane-anchored protein YitT (DUF2179 family) n=1 Tax=Lactobacillus colini TaxID=1819254 RepID=A0ABS4MB66_9LACO|nr:YitT family protein [Lactobacillus colini]MBP2056913.1 uncharacterized membrane-anchored protein YitT (DUF2179 family) [Lactobacillus colini]
MNKNLKKRSWMKWIIFLIGLEIIAISINFFYGPINIAAGGSTGISILVDAVWGVNRSLIVLIVNIFMLILSWFFLGKKITQNIAIGSLLLPLLMQITPSFKLTNNYLLAVIFGGALMGLGVTLLYRINASSGGTTVIPMILKKYFYIDSSIGLLGIDMIIIFLNVFVAGWEAFLLAALSQVVTSITMNYTEAGFDRKYQIRVMSNNHFRELKKILMEDTQGLTLYNVEGGYSQDEKQQILVVVDRRDYGPLISKIHEIDPDAFIITDTVVRVHGGQWEI